MSCRRGLENGVTRIGDGAVPVLEAWGFQQLGLLSSRALCAAHRHGFEPSAYAVSGDIVLGTFESAK